jgi:hypothetical protein
MSVAQQIIRDKFNQQSALVFYVRGQIADGQSVYAYTAMRTSEWDNFRSDLRRKKDVTLEQYGVVLASGPGEPSDSLKAEMKQRYGVES